MQYYYSFLSFSDFSLQIYLSHLWFHMMLLVGAMWWTWTNVVNCIF